MKKNKPMLRAEVLLLLAVATASTAVCGLAQAPAVDDRQPAFEVVSIRRDSSPAHGEEIAVTRDGWHMEHGSLMAPLLTAYVPTTPDAMMYTTATLAGIPDWMRTELYDIDAKVAPADLQAWQDLARQRAMLRSMMQALLADRCKLVVHRGTKDVAVYSLVIGKGGPKLKPAVPGDPHPGATPIPGGGEVLSNDGAGNASFYDAPVRALVVVLSNLAERPVEDRTGLTGLYDMSFHRQLAGAGAPSPEPDLGPTIFDV